MSAPASELHQTTSPRLPRILIADGTLEAFKWFALALMTADHVNKYLFDAALPFVFEAARVVMPIFGFILAYNLARPGAFERGAFTRTLRRLGFFAALASPIFLALNGFWPLNVLWMLFVAAMICYCIERDTPRLRAAAVALFLVGGAVVEFFWFGLAFVVGAWLYCRRPSWLALCGGGLGAISLTLANQNWFALCALPLIAAAPSLRLRVPRLRWAFYGYYPAHLAVLMVLAYTTRGE